MTPAEKLIALRDALNRCLPVAYADEGKAPHQQRLFASREGFALVHAMFDLTDCGALYDLKMDIAREARIVERETGAGSDRRAA